MKRRARSFLDLNDENTFVRGTVREAFEVRRIPTQLQVRLHRRANLACAFSGHDTHLVVALGLGLGDEPIDFIFKAVKALTVQIESGRCEVRSTLCHRW